MTPDEILYDIAADIEEQIRECDRRIARLIAARGELVTAHARVQNAAWENRLKALNRNLSTKITDETPR